MFDQNLAHNAGDQPAVRCQKHAKSDSQMSAFKPWHRATLVVVLAGLAAALLAWIARTDPAINYLPRHRDAEWIVFPTAVDARAHGYASLDATFRREFILPQKPAAARLRLRALRRAEIKVNGVSIQFPQNRNWKDMSEVDIAEQLHEGANIVEVRVFNHNGPPALWLVLSSDQLNVRTNENWEASFAGSSWRHAALASAAKTPGHGNPVADGESTFDAARTIWPLWILLIGIACGGVILWRAGLKQFTSPSLERVVLFLISAMWLFLFWNNTRLLPFHAGFDSKEHLKYIDYIQQQWSLPSPTEGWEMYQPPLYYFIAAVILSLCKLSINDPASVFVLRALGAFFGIAQFALLFLTLRLLFSARTALVGLLLAAFLPMHLYLAHYVTNEVLTGTLATLTVYLCLHLLKNETPRAAHFVFVGLALGATMLTKATGILLLPIVIAAICARCIQREGVVCDFVAQSRPAHRELSRGVRLVLRRHMAEVRNAAARQLGCYKRIHLVAGSRLSHSGRLSPFRTFVSNSDVQRVCRICGRHLFDIVGRRFVGRCVERECPLEPGPDDCRLLVGFSSGSFDYCRRRRRRCPIPSKTVGRIVRVARFVCRRRAGLRFYEPESSLVRASQSVLRIICSDVALFLWRAWLGNGD